jgi:hypothetical protein
MMRRSASGWSTPRRPLGVLIGVVRLRLGLLGPLLAKGTQGLLRRLHWRVLVLFVRRRLPRNSLSSRHDDDALQDCLEVRD